MVTVNLEHGGCIQTATKNIIKTAQTQINDNKQAATCHRVLIFCGSCNNKQNDDNSSVWPQDNKNNNKISTQRHRHHRLRLRLRQLLIMLTVSMAFLQQFDATTAATILRIKDTQQHLHDTYEDYSSSSGSSGSDEIVEVIINGHEMSDNSASRHKRHSDRLYIRKHLEENSNDLEWVNPCGGEFSPPSAELVKAPRSFYLGELRSRISFEYHNINDTMNEIEIRNMGSWSKYQKFYSFIPKLKLPRNVTLKRFYRNMQTFVGAFAYLERTQYKWEDAKLKTTTNLTRELDSLLISARRVLCAVEDAINGSLPYPYNQEKLTYTSRAEMNERLKFLTKIRAAKYAGDIMEPELLDLRFAKAKYYYYLRRMWRTLRQHSKRNGQRHLGLSASSESASLPTISDENLTNEVDASISNLSSSSSSSSESSSESRSKASRQSKRSNRRHHKRQRKANRKSAELPQ